MRLLCVSDVSHAGAGVACRRLTAALRAAGHEVVWATANGAVWSAGGRDILPLDLSGELVYRLAWRFRLSSLQRERAERWKDGRRLGRFVARLRPDVIHAHNLHHNLTFGLMEKLPTPMPLVWTLHDMWPLTGYCCYSVGCGKFATGCHGDCPQMGKWGPAFRSPEAEWRHRESFFIRNAHRLHMVCPSEWMLRNVRARFGDRIHASVIRNCLDLSVFKPVRPKAAVRQALGLPVEATIVVSSAHWVDDPIKGADALGTAVSALRATGRTDLLHVAIGERIGHGEDEPHVRHTGLIRDETLMNLYYNAADVMVLPTLADNLPNTLAEALAAGTPCVASDVGGCPEMVVDGETGFLAPVGNAAALAEAIGRVLDLAPAAAERMSAACRARAEAMFDPVKIARCVLDLRF